MPSPLASFVSALSSLSFASPVAGLCALAAVPVLLAIHFLQTPSRPVPVSTLFLLERLAPESLGGRRLERLRSSLPLWLQLLTALLLAWIIAQPRWLLRDSTQTVLVLLDSSVSMRAFENELREKLPQRLETLAQSAAQTEWLLLETDPAAERLYAGPSLAGLQAALRTWKPNLGTHDPQPALQAALTLLKGRGAMLYVTDRPAPTPPGVAVFSVGKPLENVGFCGLQVSEADATWSALITNFGTTPQRRAWRVEVVGKADFINLSSGSAPLSPPGNASPVLGESREIELPPGGSQTVRGTFPPGVNALRLVLSRDDFSLDDTLPIVRPEGKKLRVERSVEMSVRPDPAKPLAPWMEALLRAEPGLELVQEPPYHLRLSTLDFHAPTAPLPPAIFDGVAFLGNKAKALTGMIVAENHPLMDGLRWEGLRVPLTSPLIQPQPGDVVLLWQDKHPLILLRDRQLIFRFHLADTNASRLPAFVLLLHRFIETVRAETPLPEMVNFETNQAYMLATGFQKIERHRAPAEPGFFEIDGAQSAGSRMDSGVAGHAVPLPTLQESAKPAPLLRAAVHFSDPRESDFRDARPLDTLGELIQKQRERHSRQAPFTPLALLLLGVLFGANWIAVEAKKRTN